MSLVLSACIGGGGDGSGELRVTASSPLVYGQNATFEISGRDIDQGVVVSATGCSGATLVGSATSSMATVACTPTKDGAISLTLTSSAGVVLRTESFVVPKPQIKMATSVGNLLIELEPSKAPITVNNFLAYAASGFYDNTVFHRIISNFMGQGGGYTFSGSAYAYKTPTQSAIALERTTATGLSNTAKTIAMARTPVADSATSQFFINFEDNSSFLDAQKASDGNGYAVFGTVISTAQVDSDTTLNALKNIAVTYNGSDAQPSLPFNPPVIQSAVRVQ